MTPREMLRTRLGVEEEPEPRNEPEDSDEEILNVFRRELEKDDGEEELTTKEISEQLSIGQKQTHNRLEELCEKKRVEKRRAGRSHMWKLAPGEPRTVMNPELGPVIEKSSRARQNSSGVKMWGYQLGAIGFVLLIIGMTLWISELAASSGDIALFLGFGYSFGVVGAFIYMAGILLYLAGVVTPGLTERFLLE